MLLLCDPGTAAKTRGMPARVVAGLGAAATFLYIVCRIGFVRARVSDLARQDYLRNVFDPNNFTAAQDSIKEARKPVNVLTTSTSW